MRECVAVCVNVFEYIHTRRPGESRAIGIRVIILVARRKQGEGDRNPSNFLTNLHTIHLGGTNAFFFIRRWEGVQALVDSLWDYNMFPILYLHFVFFYKMLGMS